MAGSKLSTFALGIGALALSAAAVNAQSSKEYAPGQIKEPGESARELAPGQIKEPGESAREYAPGQQDKDETTGRSSTMKPLKEPKVK